MSALGQKRTFPRVNFMSALPPKADIRHRDWPNVCATSALPSQAKLFDVGLIPSNKGGLFPLTF